MATEILPADNSGTLALNSILGIADNAVDVWSKWNTQKQQNTQAKNAIPSDVVQKQAQVTNGFQLDQKTVLIGAGVLVAVVAVVIIATRK